MWGVSRIPNKEVPLEEACLFNNHLRCHPKTAGRFVSAKFADALLFVEKVCEKCPTYKWIQDKGIPK